MEDMSEAYLRTLCAADGFLEAKGNHDNDGVDVTVSCNDRPTEGGRIKSPRFDVQLKSSSSNNIKLNEDGSVTYYLEAKNYNKLVDGQRMIPINLVVLHMHADERQWLEQTVDYLKITKCAYWMCLKGYPPTKNVEKK